MFEKDKIGIACNTTRLSYTKIHDVLNETTIDVRKDKFIIMYDMAYCLSLLENISNVSKDDTYNDSILKEDIITHICYGILNSIAHYRHYITDKLRCSSTIILYSSDPTYYDKFSITFSKIYKILNMFKKTIFIEKLENNVKFIYQHVAYFTAMNIRSNNESSNKISKIIYIGNNMLASQMLRIDRDMIHIKHNHINSGLDIFYNSDVIDIDSGMIDNRSVDLITILLSLLGFKHGYPKLDSLKKRKVASIYDTVYMNTADNIDKDDTDSVVNGLGMTNSDIDLYRTRLRTIDVDYHNKLYSMSKTLLKVWSSKLESKIVYNFNEIFDNDDIRLSVNWLIL